MGGAGFYRLWDFSTKEISTSLRALTYETKPTLDLSRHGAARVCPWLSMVLVPGSVRRGRGGFSIASDVLKVKGEDLTPPGCLGSVDSRKPRDRNNPWYRFNNPSIFWGILRFCPADNSSIRWTTLSDIRNRFWRCLKRDRIQFFLLERGGQNTSQKNENGGISDFSQIQICFRLTKINLLFFLELTYRIFQIFHLFIDTSGTVIQNGVCEWVVSTDHTLIYDPVLRFNRIEFCTFFQAGNNHIRTLSECYGNNHILTLSKC